MGSKKTIQDQARFIAQAGRKLKDHIFSVQSGLHDSGGSCRGGELSMAQVQMVMAVRESDAMTISYLAEKLKVSPPSASNMVDRLVEKGVLLRERSEKDRRKVVVRLSEKAAVHAGRMERAVLAAFLDLVEKVGPETAEKWCEVLECVEQVIANSEKEDE